jgi:plastocyanin
MNGKRWILIGLALAAATALALPALAATKNVAVQDNVFKKKRVTIAKGDRVKWVWDGVNEHNVVFIKVPTGARKPRKCGTRTSGECARRFRSKRGVYRYVCTIHLDSDDMKGRVTVE